MALLAKLGVRRDAGSIAGRCQPYQGQPCYPVFSVTDTTHGLCGHQFDEQLVTLD